MRTRTEPSQMFRNSFPVAHPDPQPLPNPHPSLFQGWVSPAQSQTPPPSHPSFYLHPALQEKVLEELSREWRRLYGGTSIPVPEGTEQGWGMPPSLLRGHSGGFVGSSRSLRCSRHAPDGAGGKRGAGGELTPSPHEYSMRIRGPAEPELLPQHPERSFANTRPSPSFPRNRSPEKPLLLQHIPPGFRKIWGGGGNILMLIPSGHKLPTKFKSMLDTGDSTQAPEVLFPWIFCGPIWD